MKGVTFQVYFLSAALFLAASLSILGCQTWPGEVPISYQYKTNRTIFVGKVISVESLPTNVDGLTETAKSWVRQYNRVEFAVTESFKTDNVERITLLALAKEVTSCDKVYPLKVGEKWLLFSNENMNGEAELSMAEPVRSSYRLDALRKIAHGGIVPAIYGQFLIGRNEPAGFGLIAESKARRYLASMDKNGQFSFDPVEPGTYHVRALFPFGGYVREGQNKTWFSPAADLGYYRFEFEATVKENDCFYRRFDVGLEEN